MNKLFGSLLLLGFGCSSFAQQAEVKIVPGPVPSTKFSNAVANNKTWNVTVKNRGEEGNGATPDPKHEALRAKYAHLQIKRIDFSHASGVRQEVIQYRDGSRFTRFIVPGFVVSQDVKTGVPLIEEPAFSASGPTWGLNRMAELAWVSDKFYIGTANYNGRECHVYRQFQTPPSSENLDEPTTKSISSTEARSVKGATLGGTVYIDKATMKPVAYEKEFEIWVYDMDEPFSAFTMPSALSDALRARAEEEAKFRQRYSVPQ